MIVAIGLLLIGFGLIVVLAAWRNEPVVGLIRGGLT